MASPVIYIYIYIQAGGGSEDGEGWSDAGDDGARADSRQPSDDDGGGSEMEDALEAEMGGSD